jgi:hypothetical protein
MKTKWSSRWKLVKNFPKLRIDPIMGMGVEAVAEVGTEAEVVIKVAMAEEETEVAMVEAAAIIIPEVGIIILEVDTRGVEAIKIGDEEEDTHTTITEAAVAAITMKTNEVGVPIL